MDHRISEIAYPVIECFEFDRARLDPIRLSRLVATATVSFEEQRVLDLEHSAGSEPSWLELFPEELITYVLSVGEFDEADLAALSLTCRRAAALTQPLLYKALVLTLYGDRSRRFELLANTLNESPTACKYVRQCAINFRPETEGKAFALLKGIDGLNSLKLCGPISNQDMLTTNAAFASLSFLNLTTECSESVISDLLTLPSLTCLYVRSIEEDAQSRSAEFRARTHMLRASSKVSCWHISRWVPPDGFRALLAMSKQLREFSACLCPKTDSDLQRPLNEELQVHRDSLQRVSIALQYHWAAPLYPAQRGRSRHTSFTDFAKLRHLEIDETLIIPAPPQNSISLHDSSYPPAKALPRELESLKIVMRFANDKDTSGLPTSILRAKWLRELITDKRSGQLTIKKLSIRATTIKYIHQCCSSEWLEEHRIGRSGCLIFAIPWNESQRCGWLWPGFRIFQLSGIELDIWDTRPSCSLQQAECDCNEPAWFFYYPYK